MSNHLLTWVRARFARARIAREIDDELQFHLQLRTSEYENTGVNSKAARRKALQRFGSLANVTAECRAIHRLPAPATARATIMEGLLQDLRYAARTLTKQPAFTVLAVATLGLGIGANTAVFAVVHSTLLRPLPFEGGERFVYLWRGKPTGPITITPSPDMLQLWRERARSFDAIATYSSRDFVIGGDGEPQTLSVATVSPELIPLLGIQPLLGRAFVPGDTIAGHDRIALLTERFWKQHFGADRDVVGRTVVLDDDPYAVVGVLPSRVDAFFREGRKDIWVPRGGITSNVARLRAGVTVAQAQAELDAIHASQELDPATPGGWAPKIIRPMDVLVASDLRTGLWVLLGAVGFVVLVACVNVANMVLARSLARGQEIAVRSALGAGKLRVFRQLLVESLLFTALAAGVGLGLAHTTLQFVTAHLPNGLVLLSNSSIDGVVLAVTLGLTILTGVFFGLVPGLQLRSLDLTRVLNHSHRAGAGSPTQSLVHQALVVAEVAMALVLFVGAGLMVNSLIRLQRVDPGFDPTNLLSFQIALPKARYAGFEQQQHFFEDVLGRIRQLPNVESAALGKVGWMGLMDGKVVPEGTDESDAESTSMMLNLVSPGYFATVGMSLQEGRGFLAEDFSRDFRGVVVNSAFARAYWPGEEAAGKRFRFSSGNMITVLGVVGDLQIAGLRSDPNQLQIYNRYSLFDDLSRQTVVVRAVGDPNQVIPLLKGQVWSVDPTLPVKDMAVATRLLSDAIARPRFNALLFSGFAALSLILATIGVYGVISLTLQQRMHELGVRVALGAQDTDVFRLMIAYGMRPIAVGIGVGVVLAVGLTRFMQSLLFEVQPTDPTTYATVIAVLGTAGLAACYLPARRATRVDPVEALRAE